MKATELMIGNIVEVNGVPQRIRQVSRRKIGYCPLGSPTRSYARVNEVNPIPITEELLVRNGFEKIPNIYRDYRLQIKDYKIEVHFGSCAAGRVCYVTIEEPYGDQIAGNDISYLHQLQNLLNIMDIKLDFVV